MIVFLVILVNFITVDENFVEKVNKVELRIVVHHDQIINQGICEVIKVV